MPELNFTPEQRAAIDTRGSTVLVSAAAGSGKTRVLTERLMAYLTDAEHPVDIDHFLVITYTRAAAAELRSRILDGIYARIASDPENRRLRRQVALCARAEIGTIHSFCADFLRANCAALALAPDFQVADTERCAALRAAALEHTLERAYTRLDTDAPFRLLADTVGGGRDDARLGELVLSLYDKMQCHARPEQWAQRQVDLLALDGVTDPQNLGAAIRSAAAFGANGVILPERRSASVTAAAWKVSAGAAAHIPVARVVNLTKAIESMRERGYYTVGLDGGGDKLVGETGFETDPLIVVLGSEGKGLSRLVRESCDAIAGIPITSMVESLNASVAAGISLYAVARARREAAAAATK